MNAENARPQRLRYLFVHAHPDDETLATGVALASLVRAGHDVHLLTCTLGEEGEVIPTELRHLAADADDALGPYRRGELRAAMAAFRDVEGQSQTHAAQETPSAPASEQAPPEGSSVATIRKSSS